MLLQAVFVFGMITAVFELVLLSFIPIPQRLRLLGSELGCALMHIFFLSFNLWIHWGTLIGTMTGISAFIVSLLTVKFARRLWGYVRGDSYWPGWRAFNVKEL